MTDTINNHPAKYKHIELLKVWRRKKKANELYPRWFNRFESFYSDVASSWTPGAILCSEKGVRGQKLSPHNFRWLTYDELMVIRGHSVECLVDGEWIPIVDAMEAFNITMNKAMKKFETRKVDL